MARQPVFLPKIVTCLRGYSRAHFLGDLSAGLTVGVVALPLALAFGIASIPEDVASEVGISPPAIGLITGVIAGLLISLLGGSRVSIGGPTGAFVGIVYVIAATHGYDGLLLATLMAGVFLILMGLAQLGGLIKYIPYPVTTGFTSGIAVVIAFGQFRDLLGLDTGPLPPHFVERVRLYAASIHSIDAATAAIGIGTIVGILVLRRFVSRRFPAPIVVILVATVIVHGLGLSVETVGGRFGALPSGFPAMHVPAIDWSRLPELVWPAMTIALLASIESLLCAVVADGMLGTRHRSNTELIAQGIANIASPLFGGIPATGAIARTATNVQAGGRTPIAGIIHALILLIVMLALGRYASMIPLASLAGILIVVAWNMAEFHSFRWLLTAPRSDAVVLLATFGLTVLVDLTVAVQVGMVLAALLFIKRMAEVTSVSAIRTDLIDDASDTELPASGKDEKAPPSGVEVYKIDGPFFFGAAFKLREALDTISRPPKILILDLSHVDVLDATGLHALEEIRLKAKTEGSRIILVGVHAHPLVAMTRAGILERFGSDAFVDSIEHAIEQSRVSLSGIPGTT